MSEPGYVPDRRPISARQHPWSIGCARTLARWGVSPNAISTAGMIAGILAGAAFAGTSYSTQRGWLFVAAAAFMQLRLLANMFDGMVAIETSRASPLGELFNEVPDRVSDAAILIGAGYAFGGVAELGYFAAVLALFTAYVRAEGKVAGAPQEFCGPMAKQQRMAVLTFAALFAAVVPEAWQPHHSSFPGWGVIAAALLIIVAGSAVTAMRRLRRIASNLRKRAGSS
jgi:phosphatidylglycerophosphate synthase